MFRTVSAIALVLVLVGSASAQSQRTTVITGPVNVYTGGANASVYNTMRQTSAPTLGVQIQTPSANGQGGWGGCCGWGGGAPNASTFGTITGGINRTTNTNGWGWGP